MGKLVTFWSPYKGHGKTTASLCAVAGGVLLNHPELKFAISHTQKDALSLSEKLDNRNDFHIRENLYENLGISTLKMYFRQMAISDEVIINCGIPLLMKSVYFYPNIQNMGNNNQLDFQILTKHMGRTFDFVFLDLESSNPREAVSYMKEADFPVIVLPQEPAYVEQFFQKADDYSELKDFGIIFGGCFQSSRYNISYYKKNTSQKIASKLLGEIYLNHGFFEAMSEGRTLDYFLRNQFAVKKEENYEFICQAKKTAECIYKKIMLT